MAESIAPTLVFYVARPECSFGMPRHAGALWGALDVSSMSWALAGMRLAVEDPWELRLVKGDKKNRCCQPSVEA